MKKVAIVTSTRAEYGLLLPVIKELRKNESKKIKIFLIVTGTHLIDEFGKTIVEIEERIDFTVPVSVNSESEMDISNNQADALIKFTKLFYDEKFDGVVLLGDRYEILSVAIAAGNTRTPIFHLCGGDTTEGAMDEWIRHSITKISYIHFVTNEESRRRVIQLGENPDRVFNFGSTSIDNILSLPDLTKEDVLQSIGLEECEYALCTYHPVTMDSECVDVLIEEFLEAIKLTPNVEFIITKSNADKGGARINELLDEANLKINNVHLYSSLGTNKYLLLMKYAKFVIGNSSSGIIEAPAFSIPTINIGNRQKGRLQSKSIINCGSTSKEIKEAIEVAINQNNRNFSLDVANPYGNGNASKKISDKIIEIIENYKIDLKKSFYEI